MDVFDVTDFRKVAPGLELLWNYHTILIRAQTSKKTLNFKSGVLASGT